MKLKNVKVGKEYILKGNQDSWFFTGNLGDIQAPLTRYDFKKGDKVIVDRVWHDGTNDVKVSKGTMGLPANMALNCKFLKKIKGDK